MSINHNAGIFFDLDGTLVDNIEMMFLSYKTFMEGNGLAYSRKEFNELNGIPLKKILLLFKEKYRLSEDFDDLFEKYQNIIRKEYLGHSPRMFAKEAIVFARENEIKVGIVTSSPTKLVEEWLSRNLPRELIDVVITGEDVTCGKPYAEPYLKAMEVVGVKSGIAIEDSEKGVLSAFSAGLRVIQIKQKQEDPDFPNVWKSITDFAKLKEYISEV